MEKALFCCRFSNGVEVVNCTPHKLVFREPEGDLVEVEPSGFLLSAKVEEQTVKTKDGVEIVRTVYKRSEEGMDEYRNLLEQFPGAFYVCSAITVQAYKGLDGVVGMVLEKSRADVSEKIVRSDKFYIV